MKRSTEQSLPTHTGSLRRAPALLEALQQRDQGESESAALGDQVRKAVADIVQRHAQAGVSVVNDGEASKIGYSTYVKERLQGFGGEGGMAGIPADLSEFPDYMQRVMEALTSRCRPASARSLIATSRRCVPTSPTSKRPSRALRSRTRS